MPALTVSDLEADDANIEDLFNKYTRFGFKFETSALEGDKVTIVADNGDKRTVAVDKTYSPEQISEIDSWMRSRAVDKGTTLDAHLETVGISSDRRDEIKDESIDEYDNLMSSIENVKDTRNRNRSDDFKTVGDLWDFMISASGQGAEALEGVETAVEVALGGGTGDRISIPEAWKGENFTTKGGASHVVDVLWQSAKQISQQEFLNNYTKPDGSKLTEKEKRDFFTKNSVVSIDERDRATQEIETNAKAISIDDYRLKNTTVSSLSIEREDKQVRLNIADSVESLSSKIINKADTQEVLKDAAEQ